MSGLDWLYMLTEYSATSSACAKTLIIGINTWSTNIALFTSRMNMLTTDITILKVVILPTCQSLVCTLSLEKI